MSQRAEEQLQAARRALTDLQARERVLQAQIVEWAGRVKHPEPAVETQKPLSALDEVAFTRFVRDVHERLEKGAREYGDASFERPAEELLEELHQEALDLAGWGFILATRTAKLRARVLFEGEPCTMGQAKPCSKGVPSGGGDIDPGE